MQQSIFTVALIMGLMGGNTVAQPVNKPIHPLIGNNFGPHPHTQEPGVDSVSAPGME